ncbi:hypothetical protein K1719_030666 [Acacia pycnantha]|nr:hypothetical protein K1719_030666 [Acacia pycnantha]
MRSVRPEGNLISVSPAVGNLEVKSPSYLLLMEGNATMAKVSIPSYNVPTVRKKDFQLKHKLPSSPESRKNLDLEDDKNQGLEIEVENAGRRPPTGDVDRETLDAGLGSSEPDGEIAPAESGCQETLESGILQGGSGSVVIALPSLPLTTFSLASSLSALDSESLPPLPIQAPSSSIQSCSHCSFYDLPSFVDIVHSSHLSVRNVDGQAELLQHHLSK